jgi:sugar transferase (PEP-CTERM system associated)
LVRILRQYYSASAIYLCLLETSIAAFALYGAARWLVPADSTAMMHYVAAALVTALVVACVTLTRLVATPLARAQFPAHRVLVLGAGRIAAEIERIAARPRQGRAEIVGYVAPEGAAVRVSSARLSAVAGSLLDHVRRAGVTEIVVALDDRRGMPLEPLLEARMEGIAITPYLDFCERETRRINIAALDPGWLIYGDGFRIADATSRFLKRALDIAASLGLLLVALPTLVLAAIAIRCDSPGPIFYWQTRVGRRGVPFQIVKFRTMRVDAETACGPQWAALDDARVTGVGRLLRRLRIDELPQILNVLRGEMSFVGPRPERPFFVQRLAAEIPFYAERHRVRPGITGWAQINYPYGSSTADAAAKLSYDLYYIKHFSFVSDLAIILSTIRTVLFDQGAR